MYANVILKLLKKFLHTLIKLIKKKKINKQTKLQLIKIMNIHISISLNVYPITTLSTKWEVPTSQQLGLL